MADDGGCRAASRFIKIDSLPNGGDAIREVSGRIGAAARPFRLHGRSKYGTTKLTTPQCRHDLAGRAAYGAFSDPEAMMQAMHATNAWVDGPRPLVKSGARFHATMARATFGRLSIGTGTYSPAVSIAGTTSRQHHFVFAVTPDTVRRVLGWELSGPRIFQMPPEARVVANSPQGRPWTAGFVSIPFDELAEHVPGLLAAGYDASRNAGRVIDVPAAAMVRLTGLVCDLSRLARDTPWVIEAPAPAAALSGAVLDALGDCLGQGRSRPDRAAIGRHREIVARFERALADRPEDLLSLGDICRIVGVAPRTLNLACLGLLGMGAAQYARQWRLGLVREHLLAADPATTLVTSVAMRFGFWELGRFASAYRLRFGERPSETLRRRGF